MSQPEKTTKEPQQADCPYAPCSAALDALMKHPKTVVNELDSGREDDTAWYIVVPHKYAMQVANERDWLRIRNEALSAELDRLWKLRCEVDNCPWAITQNAEVSDRQS